jgi:hypothetical protein
VVVRTWADVQAWNSQFGVGLAGTLGVPSLSMVGEAVLGGSFSLVIERSTPGTVTGLLHVGFAQAALPVKGGILYTIPWQSIPLPLLGPANQFVFSLPLDLSLTQLGLTMQMTMPDPGAPVGFSFTNGLQMVLGV